MNNECVICLENINSLKQENVELLCMHNYHKKCILKLYNENENENEIDIKCPICRYTSNIYQIHNNKELLNKYYSKQGYKISKNYQLIELLIEKLTFDISNNNKIDTIYYIDRINTINLKYSEINKLIINLISIYTMNLNDITFLIEYLLKRTLEKINVYTAHDYITNYYNTDIEILSTCLYHCKFNDYSFIIEYIFLNNVLTNICKIYTCTLNDNILEFIFSLFTSSKIELNTEQYHKILYYLNNNTTFIESSDSISIIKMNFITRSIIYNHNSKNNNKINEYLYNIIIHLTDFDDKYILSTFNLTKKYYTYKYISLYFKYNRNIILEHFNSMYIIEYKELIDFINNFNCNTSLNNIAFLNIIDKYTNSDNILDYQSINILNNIIVHAKRLNTVLEHDYNLLYSIITNLINNITDYSSIYWDGLYTFNDFYDNLNNKYNSNNSLNTIRYYIYHNLINNKVFINYILDNVLIFSDILFNFTNLGVKLLTYIIKNYSLNAVSYILKNMDFPLLFIIFLNSKYKDYIPLITSNIDFFKNFCNDKNITGNTVIHSLYILNHQERIDNFVKLFDKNIDYSITNRLNLNLIEIKNFFNK